MPARRRRPPPKPKAAKEVAPDGAASNRNRGTRLFISTIFSRYKTLPGWTPNLATAFIVLLMVRVLGALVGIMSDCDEAYNYWEPLHYLVHGRGLQTWEYSSKYALRSYAYLLPYAAVAKLTRLLVASADKVREVYAIRVVQAVLSALAELALYDSAVWRFGAARGRVFLALLATSPGLFRTAPELLPSSFAMIALTYATSRWFVGEFQTAVSFVALAALFGWVYAAAAAVPMALHIMYRRGLVQFVLYAVGAAAWIVSFMIAVDTYYYGRPVLVPLLHVLYNVFPVPGAGPELFGVEPFSYYVINMVLNVPLAVPIVALLPAMLVLQSLGARVCGDAKQATNRLIFLSAPLVMGAMMASVPHKEERFLAPLYPTLALLSAVVLVDWVEFIVRVFPMAGAGDIRANAAKLLTTVVVVFTAALGVSRAYMQVHAFGAPLRLYTALSRDQLSGIPPSGSDVNLCLGKEWHRFPSHFFIPNRRVKVRFVRHGFNGALPRYYVDAPMASRQHQDGMNMFNKQHPSQWFNVTADSGCHYLVDLDLSHRDDASVENPGQDQLDVAIPPESRHVLYSEDFLDVERSPAGIRAFWIPRYSHKLVYGKYVVVRNKHLPL